MIQSHALMAMRKRANEYLPDNEKLSVNDFILKAVALTLRQFPNLNATIKDLKRLVQQWEQEGISLKMGK